MGAMAKTDKTWNLSALYKSDDDPQMAADRQKIEAATKAFEDKWRGRDDYKTDPKVLKEALDDYEAWAKDYSVSGSEFYYFNLRSNQDQNDPKVKAKVQSITEFANNNLNRIQFFELELAKIKAEDQAKVLAENSLEIYKHFLERNFASSKHQLSEAEERIMNLKSDTSYTRWVDMTSGFLSKEERETLLDDGMREKRNYEGLMTLTQSQDAKVRDEANEHLEDIFGKYLEVAEIEMNAIMANKKVNDELRHYDRPDSSRHLGDDIPTEVVDILVKTVADNNDIAKRFYSLKAKLLGKTSLRYFERNVEYGNITNKFSYEESLALVSKVFGELDPFFAETLQDFDKSGQIDVYPRPGKWGGAFCAYNLKKDPVYVLLNYTDTLKDVTTLAHEMGHAINDECMRQAVISLNFGTPTATAEVASQFMEDFVLDELMETANDDELRLAIMVNRLNDAVSSIFRQIACYRFEKDLHDEFRKQGYLSKDEIGKIFHKNMTDYMGEAAAGCENWWTYWSHIRTFFYVYSYAGGLLIAKAMQDRVRADHKFIENVKTFFAGGLTKSPVELFAEMGIDVTTAGFWKTGLDQVDQLLKDAEALAKKLGKLPA